MSSAFVMTTRLIWKRAWLGALCTVLLLVTGPVTLPAVFRVLPDSIAGDLAQVFHSQLFILGLSWVAFGFLCIHAAYQSPLQLTRGLPVSSTRIASWVMWSTVVMVVVPSLLINGLVRLLFMDASWSDRDYSVLGPTLFITAFIMVAWSAYWSLQAKGFWRLLFWASAVGALVAWLVSRYYPEGKLVPWKVVTLTEWITVLVVCGTGWLAGVRAYATIRCGAAVTSLIWSRVEAWLNGDQLRCHNQAIPNTGSRTQAFARLHWKEGCQPVVLTMMVFGGASLLLNLSGYLYKDAYGVENPVIGSNPAVCTTMVFLVSSFSLLLTLGLSLTPRDFLSMKDFLAQLPVSNRQVSNALVINLLKSLGHLVFWVVIVGLGGSYLFMVFHQGVDVLKADWNWMLQYQSKENFILVPLVYLLTVWTLIANGLALIWTGHAKFIGQVFYLGMVFFFLTIILPMGPLRNQWTLFSVAWILLSIGLIWTTTILAYRFAYRRELVTRRTIWLAILFCLVVLPLSWNYWGAEKLLDRCFLSTLLILPVLPFATIPLAVSWNRHR
ncbi:hypothetical protein CA11_56120 [Gimesia maris]|uniref:hypothetical protein n=1 Tax=Gimesia maris TaxID=122 RepID=UPI0011883AD8|nr:hypothetical protein [Gimesia maris]QDU17763.1 hypothetical protein CA11_56120 [Gimesia maris]